MIFRKQTCFSQSLSVMYLNITVFYRVIYKRNVHAPIIGNVIIIIILYLIVYSVSLCRK